MAQAARFLRATATGGGVAGTRPQAPGTRHWWRQRHIAIGRSDKSNHRTGDDKAHWQSAHVVAIKKRLLRLAISAAGTLTLACRRRCGIFMQATYSIVLFSKCPMTHDRPATHHLSSWSTLWSRGMSKHAQ